MSFMTYESSQSRDKARNELRAAREELLKSAEERAQQRKERESRGGSSSFTLSSLDKKINKKKKKESKKCKKKKSKKRMKSSSESDDSDSGSGASSSPERSRKKKKKKYKKYSDPSSSSSSDSDSDSAQEQWIEKSEPKPKETTLARDDWMTSNLLLPTFSKEKREKQEKKNIDDYDPSKSVKELNPYWKDGGTGLPSAGHESSSTSNPLKRVPVFQRPDIDNDFDGTKNLSNRKKDAPMYPVFKSGWKKKPTNAQSAQPSSSREQTDQSPRRSRSKSPVKEENHASSSSASSGFLTDQQMNELGAKIVKAEIMGNDELAAELKEKLDRAREARKNAPKLEKKGKEVVILTRTNETGLQQPLQPRTSTDPYSGGRQKRPKTNTHVDGERVRFFPDDDKYDLRQMFESEKFVSANDSDAQFAKIAAAASKGKNQDNLEDIFADEVHKSMSEHKQGARERDRAIQEHQRMEAVLGSCMHCIESSKMDRQLIVAMGNYSYLALPWHEGLATGHCIIAPTNHASCSTQVDEEVWEEMTQFRKALTRMFGSRKQDVIFFETARYLHKRPHLLIHCVPSKEFELAPMYFKKAIQESEREWSTNKQLIELKDGKDVRRAIPRTLPYFWVNFGMDSGFAHVIEEQERFPSTFAQEVIAGLLELDPRAYRRPRKLHNPGPKVQQFAEWWKLFDFTNKS